MKIWFGTTTLKYKEYKKYYLAIRQHIIDSGHILTDDWIGECGNWIEDNPYAERGIKKLYEKVVNAMNDADVSIIEITVPNFSSAHQIDYSIKKRKPTLVLRLRKEHTFKDSYIDAIESPFLKIENYNLKNYKDKINEFLGYAEVEEGQQRYNVILSKKNKYYLDWAAAKYKKSRSEILRDLIENKMEADENFRIYLKT